MTFNYESELAQLLDDLSTVQGQLLAVLQRKRECLMKSDVPGLAALAADESHVVVRLQACHDRRGQLLAHAKDEGLPSKDLRSLAGSLPRAQRTPLEEQMRESESRSRLLQHHSLTNWVVAQRSLLHLAQMLEILATGGRIQPTYGSGEPVNSSGALLDHAA